MQQKLIIGTRGSKMALVQTNIVARALVRLHPALAVETKIIVTKGDRDLTPIPLDTVGKDWFTKEIEAALLSGEIDLAVHSLKDVAPVLPNGLAIQPVLQRDDPRDALVPRRTGQKLQDLPLGAVIGTDSLRRKANLLRLRPDLEVRSVRGNVQTRLQKLEQGDYDAIVLAAAGLERLGERHIISEWFSVSEFVPASGQGVLAVETRAADGALGKMIRVLQDEPTAAAVAAEQAFLAVVGGGCKLPVACYVDMQSGGVTIYGMLGTDDAARAVTRSVHGPVADGVVLARQLASELLRELHEGA